MVEAAKFFTKLFFSCRKCWNSQYTNMQRQIFNKKRIQNFIYISCHNCKIYLFIIFFNTKLMPRNFSMLVPRVGLVGDSWETKVVDNTYRSLAFLVVVINVNNNFCRRKYVSFLSSTVSIVCGQIGESVHCIPVSFKKTSTLDENHFSTTTKGTEYQSVQQVFLVI